MAGRGRKKAPVPVIDYIKLDGNWPEDKQPRTPKAREKGVLRKKPTLNQQSKGITVLDAADTRLTAQFVTMKGKGCTVCWQVTCVDDAINEEHPNPGVVLLWEYMHKTRKPIAVDKYTSPLANLNACIDTLKGMHALLKHDAFSEFSQVVDRFSSTIAMYQPKRLPSKLGLDYKTQWDKILEIEKCMINYRNNLPKDRYIIGEQLQKLREQYHPDKPTSPLDNGQSFALIQNAANHISDIIDGKDHCDKQAIELKGAPPATVENPSDDEGAPGVQTEKSFTWAKDDGEIDHNLDPKVVERQRAILEDEMDEKQAEDLEKQEDREVQQSVDAFAREVTQSE